MGLIWIDLKESLQSILPSHSSYVDQGQVQYCKLHHQLELYCMSCDKVLSKSLDVQMTNICLYICSCKMTILTTRLLNELLKLWHTTSCSAQLVGTMNWSFLLSSSPCDPTLGRHQLGNLEAHVVIEPLAASSSKVYYLTFVYDLSRAIQILISIRSVKF